MLILEIKGYEQDVENAKHQAVQRWVKAVNNLDKSAHWGFHINRNPTELGEQLENLLHQDW